MKMEQFSGAGLVEGLYRRWVEAHPEALEARNLWLLFAPGWRGDWTPAAAYEATGWVEANISESEWEVLYINLDAGARLRDGESLTDFRERILAAFESSWTEWFLDLLVRFGFEWFDLSDELAALGDGDYLVVVEVGAALRFPPSFPLSLWDFKAEVGFEGGGLDLGGACSETGTYRFRWDKDAGERVNCLYTTMGACE